MHPLSAEILAKRQVRKTKKQKAEFEAFLIGALRDAGYADARAEEVKSLVKCRNIVAGDPDRAKVIYTAHYDTCAVMPVPNFITPTRPLIWILYQILLVLGIFLIASACATLVWLLPVGEEIADMLAHLVYLAVLWFEIIWMVAGKANKHTANDNTSGVITLLEIALALPEERRSEVCFVWFDHEESGLFGSMGFREKHKQAAKETLTLNFDCVSDGDHMLFVLPKKMKDDPLRDILGACFPSREGIESVFTHTGKAVYPSDQTQFKRGIGVAALKKSRYLGLYMDRIHTAEDTVFEEKNIEYLANGAIALAERV